MFVIKIKSNTANSVILIGFGTPKVDKMNIRSIANPPNEVRTGLIARKIPIQYGESERPKAILVSEIT